MRRAIIALPAVALLAIAVPAAHATPPVAGRALACHTKAPADFSGSGRSGLAVGAPFAEVGSHKAQGVVTVFGGSASGLVPKTSLTRSGQQFGAAMAAGDFNGDGCSDLAVVDQFGHTATVDHAQPAYGSISVYRGHQSKGLTSSPNTITGADFPGIEATCALSDKSCPVTFEPVAAVGDINGDGYQDLITVASGTTGDDASNDELLIIPGSGTGLQPGKATILPIGSAQLPGTEYNSTRITALAVGDVDGDGHDDIAMGFTNGANDQDPGVDLIYGSTTVATGGRATQLWDRSRSGVPGTDDGGTNISVALGDFRGDGHADLAFAEAGTPSVTVVYGTSHGLSTANVQTWSKSSPGIKGATQNHNDVWGSSLIAGRFGRASYEDLVVADDGTEQISVLSGSAAHGLVATNDVLWSQNTPGLPGTRHDGDSWGSTLAVGYFGHGVGEDLAIGAPYVDDLRGSVTILYGSPTSPTGLRTAHAQLLTRNSKGVPGTAKSHDNFGAALDADS